MYLFNHTAKQLRLCKIWLKKCAEIIAEMVQWFSRSLARDFCVCRSILSCLALIWVPKIDSSSCQTPTEGGWGSSTGWVRRTEQSLPVGSTACCEQPPSLLYSPSKMEINLISFQLANPEDSQWKLFIWVQLGLGWLVSIKIPDFSELSSTSVLPHASYRV